MGLGKPAINWPSPVVAVGLAPLARSRSSSSKADTHTTANTHAKTYVLLIGTLLMQKVWGTWHPIQLADKPINATPAPHQPHKPGVPVQPIPHSATTVAGPAGPMLSSTTGWGPQTHLQGCCRCCIPFSTHPVSWTQTQTQTQREHGMHANQGCSKPTAPQPTTCHPQMQGQAAA